MHIFRMSFRVLIVSIVILLCFVSCKLNFGTSASDYPLNELTVERAVVNGVNSNSISVKYSPELSNMNYYWDYSGNNTCDFSQLCYIPNLTPIESSYYGITFDQPVNTIIPLPKIIYFNNKEFYGIDDFFLGHVITRYRIITSSISIEYQN
jgi:hypothetical protein